MNESPAAAAPDTQPVSYPDRPHWGPLIGIAAWVFSVASLVVVPLFAALAWLVVYLLLGNPLPTDQSGMASLLLSPASILVQVVATFPAHLLTLLFCWLIVTRRGKVPFFEAIGWRWTGRSAGSKIIFLIVVIVLVFAVMHLISRFVPPPQESEFERLIRSSQAVRISIALLAVLSAPIIEEVVYRGVLFAGLVKRVGAIPTILIVTLLFAGVHYYQYWGSWGSIAGLTVLSFAITAVRAITKSLFPCVAIHFIFNTIGAMEIVFSKYEVV